jgi:hypothetical protein
MAEQIKFGDRLFLKGEKLVLDNGASDGVIKSKNGTVKIDGNLTVSGTTTTVESETVTIADNILLINSNVTGTPTESGGIEVERGTETNVQFLWNEGDTRWTTGAQTFHAGAIVTPMITGNVTGDLTGNVTSTGISTFSSIDVNGGNIDGAVIGSVSPQVGTFTTLTATTLIGDLDYSNLINVPTIVDHSIDTLSDVDTTTVAPTTGQTIIWNGTNFVPGDTFSEVVEDTTPQLGGNLDLNTHDLSTTDNFATLTTSTSIPVNTNVPVVSSSETNLSNTTVAFFDDTGNVSNATSAYTTLTSTEIDNLGFKGEISLTYFGAAAPTSKFVWRDVSDNAEQNDMITVYAPSSDEYTFTLDHETLWQIDSTDNDVYFKQYAYGEFSITSATALTTSNTQFKDSNGFYIDPDHTEITNTSGNIYKIVFWTHDVTVGDLIDVFVGSPQQNVVFGWGGITTTGGRLTLLDTSGNLIYKFPTADGTASQVLTTNGSGDLSWTTGSGGGSYANSDVDTHLNQSNPTSGHVLSWNGSDYAWVANAGGGTTYTAGTNITISGSNVISSTDTDTTYTAGTNVTISGSNVISSTDTNTVYADSDVATYLGGNLDTHILPDTNDTYDIGSATYKIRDLYLGSNSLHIGSNTLSTSGSKLMLNGEDVMDYSNITSKPTTLAGYGITDGGGDWSTITNTPTTLAGYGITDGGGSGGSSYANSDVDVHLNVSGATTGQLLSWNGTDYAWATDTNTDTTYTAGTGLTLVGTEFRNTAPDQTVSLTGSGATTITGTYPNFTIDSSDTDTNTTYTSGTNVTIDGSNMISSTDTNTTYTAGTGLSLVGTEFSLSAAHFDGNYNSLSNKPNLTTPTFDSITTSGLTVTGTGSITLASGNDLSLTATDRVKVTGNIPFKLAVMTRTQRDAISLPENGDMIFLSDTSPSVNKFQGYADGSWVDLH